MVAVQTAAAVAAITGGALSFAHSEWDLPLFVTLLSCAIVGDLTAIVSERTRINISGNQVAIVLAMVLLGPLPAATIGVVTVAVGWLRWRERANVLFNNVLVYALYPLAGGIAFDLARDFIEARPSDTAFYALVFVTFVLASAVNFLLVSAYEQARGQATFAQMWRWVAAPGVPSQLVAALFTAAITFLYVKVGIEAIALFVVLLFTFQYLLGKLLVSEERADELERRTEQLASLQVGLLSSLLRTLDLRDRMTARHSAAVARYSREIAAAAGLSEEEQELVHTAGLLHDIGKFIFPDHILKADKRLSDQDWNMIRTHPYQGAKIVSQVDGYGPVSDIILGHHERIDGKGYPRGIKGDDIPLLSRIISVADVYDVITARDSYRVPVSSFEAIHELRRVAGTQLDPHFVDVFVELLAGKDVRYRHGEEADFDAELALEKRVHAYAAGDTVDEETRRADADGAGLITPQQGETASQRRATGSDPL